MQKKFISVKELIAEKERRTEGTMSFRDVEDATGLSKNTVGKWARNENKSYDREVIAKLLEYFDCTISELLVYEESVNNQ